MKKIFAICAVFLLALGLTGCDNDYGNDGREIRDRLIVQGIGVDRTADGYLLTLQAFNTAVAGGQDDGMSGNVTKVYETSGATIADAMRNVTLTAGRRPLYSHNWIIVFGADVAREGLNETLEFFCAGLRHTASGRSRRGARKGGGYHQIALQWQLDSCAGNPDGFEDGAGKRQNAPDAAAQGGYAAGG